MDKVPTTTKLCKLLRESYVDWNQVIQICKTHKHYTKTKDWKHRTPLHIACLKHPPPPLNALKAIVKANRRALLLPDVDGMLPIHYVCKEGEDTYELLSMLGVLIRYCPESILIQDRKGCTPPSWMLPRSKRAGILQMSFGCRRVQCDVWRPYRAHFER
jgi:hypothetical protein